MSVCRQQDVAPSEQKAVLTVPMATALPPSFERFDSSPRDAARLPLPPAVLVDRRYERSATTGGAQEWRQEEDGALEAVRTGGVLEVDHVGLRPAHGPHQCRQIRNPPTTYHPLHPLVFRVPGRLFG